MTLANAKLLRQLAGKPAQRELLADFANLLSRQLHVQSVRAYAHERNLTSGVSLRDVRLRPDPAPRCASREIRLAVRDMDRAKVMLRLNRTTLLELLGLYERAIKDLEETRDPGVAGLIRRFERHRAEVIAALAAQGAA